MRGRTQKLRPNKPRERERARVELSRGAAAAPRRAVVAIAVCGLLLAAAVIFGQTARHGFVNFDDDIFVYANEHVLTGLTDRGVAWAFTQFDKAGEWVPLTWLSLMADVQWTCAGNDDANLSQLARQMHAVNVALHAAAAVGTCSSSSAG